MLRLKLFLILPLLATVKSQESGIGYYSVPHIQNQGFDAISPFHKKLELNGQQSKQPHTDAVETVSKLSKNSPWLPPPLKVPNSPILQPVFVGKTAASSPSLIARSPVPFHSKSLPQPRLISYPEPLLISGAHRKVKLPTKLTNIPEKTLKVKPSVRFLKYAPIKIPSTRALKYVATPDQTSTLTSDSTLASSLAVTPTLTSALTPISTLTATPDTILAPISLPITQTLSQPDIDETALLPTQLNPEPTTPTVYPITSPIEVETEPAAVLVPLPATALPNPNNGSPDDDYECQRGNGYYAISNNCEQYIECKNDAAYKYTCTDGFYFNPAAEWPQYPCAQPSEVQCEADSYFHSTTPAYEYSSVAPTEVQTEPSTVSAPLPTTAKPKPNNGFPEYDYECQGISGYYAISNNCEQYIECKNDAAYKYTCTGGLYFNPAAEWPQYPCAQPSEVQCEADSYFHSTTPAYEYSSVAPTEVQTEPSTVSAPLPTTAKPKPNNGFPEYDYECQGISGYYAISNNCEQYIECKNGAAYKYTCTGGFYFNPAAEWPQYPCAQPSEVQCEAGSQLDSTTPGYPSVTSIVVQTEPSTVYSTTATTQHPSTYTPNQYEFECKQRNGYYAIEKYCDLYIECKGNIAIQYSCPDGLNFNPAARWGQYPCAYPQEVPCEGGIARQNPIATDQCPRQFGFFPLKGGECGKYLRCSGGNAFIMQCPSGLAFNFKTNSCDWPANVPSCSSPAFNNFNCPTPKADKEQHIFKYKYGNQCKEFLACQGGNPRLLSCDPGLLFDEGTQSCIPEELVKNCTATL